MEDTSAHDERVMAIVAGAFKLEAEERERYLRSLCGMETTLYDEAREVMRWEDRMGRFLQPPRAPAEDTHPSCAPGEVIAQRFEIVRKIGEGGMGVVCEAIDRKRGQKIAIKFAKPGFRRLLSPELEGALKVRHPNVCLVNEIHSVQTASGDTDFLTMELLEGETLAAMLASRGKLPIEEAREIARQLCAGLKEAHRSKVIHRDLKSANVIVCRTAEGGIRAVITDFGLSAEADRTGFFGTQRYLAPELLLGHKATYASDIFALGVILYEMVVGLNTDQSAAGSSSNSVPGPRSYTRLVSQFLSIEPEQRLRGFDNAQQQLANSGFTRRQVLGTGLGLAVTAAGTYPAFKAKLLDWLEPLPNKRFVALLAWPTDPDQRAQSIVSGAIDAMEDELARAESADRNFFITSVHNVAAFGHGDAWLEHLGESLGVNLLLQASSFQDSADFGLLLKLVDVATGATRRQHRIVSRTKEVGTISWKAVQSASQLLDVHWASSQSAERVKPSTNSAQALQSFQLAQQLRKRPNDEGLLSSIDAYKQAIESDPKYAAAYAELATVYQHLYATNADSGVLALAGANALKAIQLNQHSANGHMALAMFFDAKGDFDEAQHEIATAIRLDPTNPRNLPRQAEIYTDFRKWEQADATFRRLLEDRPNYWVAYNNHGDLLMSMGRYRDALSAFRVAVAAAPRSTLAWTNLGEIYSKLGESAQAESAYRRSLAIKESDLAYLKLAELLRVEGKYPEALACCKKAVSMEPSNDKNWLGLADCYDAMAGHGREALLAFDKAMVEVRQLLDANPTDGSALLRLALYRLKTHAGAGSSLGVLQSDERTPLELDSELLRVRVLELSGKRKEALTVTASCLLRGPVRLQLSGIKDLRSMTQDSRYLQMVAIRN